MISPPRPRAETDYAIPPGQALLELLQEVEMTQVDLARRTSRPLKTINEIVKGKTAITPETAIQFERVFGMPARFWLSLESNYREDLARIAERRELGQYLDWLKQFPVTELMKYGHIPYTNDKIQQIRELLKFFSVSSPDAWS